MDALVNDRWRMVYPDDIPETGLPMVANHFKVHIEDLGRLFAEQPPAIACFPTDNTPEEREAAQVRTNILYGYHNESSTLTRAALEKFGQDIHAAGLTAIKVWPDMRKPASKRLPRISRVDPRTILPEPLWNPHEPTDNVIVRYRDTVTNLKNRYPEQVAELVERIRTKREAMGAGNWASTAGKGALWVGGQAKPTPFDLQEYARAEPVQLEVIEYWSSEFFCAVAREVVHTSPLSLVYQSGTPAESATGAESVILIDPTPNDLSACPIQIAARSSWSLDPTGQLDSSKGIVIAKNRFFRLMLDYMVDLIYGGTLVWNVQNPHDQGPNTKFLAMGPDAKMERQAPAVSPQVGQILEMLEDEARTAAVEPRSRGGEVDLNKATAAFLSKAQGQLSSLVGSSSGAFDTAVERINEVAFEMDEKWCNAEKTIKGKARGRRFATTYTPSKAIAGDYANEVSHGGRAGVDFVTGNVIDLERLQAGVIPKRVVMENDPNCDDVDAWFEAIESERIEEGILAMLEMPQSPVPLSVRLQAKGMIDSGRPFKDVVALILPAVQAAEQPPPQNPLMSAGGLASGAPAPAAIPTRPGIPAQAPNLPPLQQVRNLGRR